MINKLVQLRSEEEKYQITRNHIQNAYCHNTDKDLSVQISSILKSIDYKMKSVRSRIELYENELLRDNLEAAL